MRALRCNRPIMLRHERCDRTVLRCFFSAILRRPYWVILAILCRAQYLVFQEATPNRKNDGCGLQPRETGRVGMPHRWPRSTVSSVQQWLSSHENVWPRARSLSFLILSFPSLWLTLPFGICCTTSDVLYGWNRQASVPHISTLNLSWKEISIRSHLSN